MKKDLLVFLHMYSILYDLFFLYKYNLFSFFLKKSINQSKTTFFLFLLRILAFFTDSTLHQPNHVPNEKNSDKAKENREKGKFTSHA